MGRFEQMRVAKTPKMRQTARQHGLPLIAAAALFDDLHSIELGPAKTRGGERRLIAIGPVRGSSVNMHLRMARRRPAASYLCDPQAGKNAVSTKKQHRDDELQKALHAVDWARIDALTDEEIEAAALSDPDNPDR